MNPTIIVIGSSNTDMICRVPFIPKPGETVLGSNFFTVQGGKGANQAVAAARAGGNVTFIACVGNDAFGRQAIESYKADNIDTFCIEIIDNVQTGVALINVADSGENCISVAPGANAFLTPQIIDNYRAVIAKADMVLLQLEIPIETVYHVIRLAHSLNIPVILNPAPARYIDPDILRWVTVLTPNEHEAAILSGFKEPDVSAIVTKLNSLGVETVIVTTGNKGAISYHKGSLETIPGITVNAVDTTAAGDTFNGYLAVELAKGKNIKEAITKANKAAAISVTRMGAQPSIPSSSEVENWL